MPLEYGPDDFFLRPNEVLASFVWTVFEDVDSTANMGPEFFLTPDAWEQVGQDPPVEAFAALREALPSVFATREALTEILLGLPPDVLASVGLEGAELRAKVLAWEYARNRLELSLEAAGIESDVDEPTAQPLQPQVRPAGKLRRGVRALARGPLRRVARWTEAVLGHADTILGSVMKLIPYGEKLLEIKETAEKLAGNVADALSD